jgi:hypothetical protein
MWTLLASLEVSEEGALLSWHILTCFLQLLNVDTSGFLTMSEWDDTSKQSVRLSIPGRALHKCVHPQNPTSYVRQYRLPTTCWGISYASFVWDLLSNLAERRGLRNIYRRCDWITTSFVGMGAKHKRSLNEVCVHPHVAFPTPHN